MKPINEFIIEQLNPINESIASSIVKNWEERYHKYYAWNWLMREFQWDKITDADLVWHDQAEAKKLAYKRNETWTLFWIANDDSLLGYSTSNYSWNTFDSDFRKMKSIMPMVRIAKGAYSIDDKFSTKALKDARAQAKMNATALMDNERIKEENLRRYEKIIKDNKIKDGSMYAGIKSRFDDISQRYKEVFDSVGSASEEDFGQKLKQLANINKYFTNALETLSEAMIHYELEKEGKPWAYIMDKIKYCDDAIKTFNSLFNN